MTLAIAGLALVSAAGSLVWFVSDRLRDILVIGALSLLLFPLLAAHLTGDISRYLPPETFPSGAAGKDQVVVMRAITIALTDSDDCRVRMQRIGPWLLVEDNDGCGGAGVTFTGLYRRKK